MDLSMATCNAEKAAMKSSEYRKVIKPLLERRRRARINSCLDELKTLILETAQNENTDASKLEKADILELTVQHLRNLRRQRIPPLPAKALDGGDKFRAGYAECAHEVSSFISTLGGVDNDVKSRLVSHLSHCISRSMDSTAPQARLTISAPTPPPSPVQLCGSPSTTSLTPTDYMLTPPMQPASPYGYAASHNYVRGDVYVWPAAAVRPISRSECELPPTACVDDFCYERHVAVKMEEAAAKPWRPW